MHYRSGIPEMAAYETLLRTVLKGVFLATEYAFLIKYFKLNLRVWYSLTPIGSNCQVGGEKYQLN
jgi:hypothetical protein